MTTENAVYSCSDSLQKIGRSPVRRRSLLVRSVTSLLVVTTMIRSTEALAKPPAPDDSAVVHVETPPPEPPAQRARRTKVTGEVLTGVGLGAAGLIGAMFIASSVDCAKNGGANGSCLLAHPLGFTGFLPPAIVLATGASLWGVGARNERALRPVTVVPSVGLDGGGLVVVGRF